MPPILSPLITMLLIAPFVSFGQAPVLIQNIRLGNSKASVTNYGVYAQKSGPITYDEILTNPTLICESAGCEVTAFTVTCLPKGADLHGPFRSSGNMLTDHARTDIQQMKVEKMTKVKIIVDSIGVQCNGVSAQVRGILVYNIR